MTIDEIYQGGNLSTRSHDICKKNQNNNRPNFLLRRL